LGHNSAKNVGIQQLEDDDLDLSEADFAPAHCSVLLQPYAVNGTEFADPPGHSDSALPLCDARDAVDDVGTFSSHSNMTSDSIHNAEASASVSVHYDAIGLPLCTENTASDSYEEVACQNSVLSPQDAATQLTFNSDSHMVKHEFDSDIMSSGNILQDAAITTGDTSSLNVSSANSVSPSACDGQVVCRHGSELESSLGPHKNITGEESDALEAVNACDGSAVSSDCSLNADNLECTTDNTTEPVHRNGAQPCVGEFQDISVPSALDVTLSVSQTVTDVQREETISANDDSCPVQLSLSKAAEVDEVHDCVDEVDKTVPGLYVMHHAATSMYRSLEAGAPSHENDHSSGDNEKLTTFTSNETLWVNEKHDETCGIDHVERITAGDISKSRVKVKTEGHTEALCAVEDFSEAECTSDTSLVVKAYGIMEADEVTVCTTELMVEADGYDIDSVTSNVPELPNIQFPDDTDRPATSLQCSDFAVDTVDDVAKTDILVSGEKPADVAERICDVPADDIQNPADSSGSLQNHVDEEMSISDVSVESLDEKDVTQQDHQPSSVNDAGDAQNADLHQKSSEQTEDNAGIDLLVTISNSTEVNTERIETSSEPSTQNKPMLTESFPEVQLISDPSLEKVDSNAPSYTDSATEPDIQEVDLLALAESEQEREKCGLNDNVLPSIGLSEFAVQDHNQVNDSISSESVSVTCAVDNVALDADVSNSITAGTDDTEKGESVVDTHVETQTEMTADVPTQHQQSADAKKRSDEDAERWFEEQFAACEDFNVDEFVSSAWSAFHLNTAILEPAVGNIYDEMLDQAAGDHKPVEVDTADAWHHVENAAVAASSVDDLCSPSSDEYSQYLDGEVELATSTSSSFQPEVPQALSSVPSNYLVNYY